MSVLAHKQASGFDPTRTRARHPLPVRISWRCFTDPAQTNRRHNNQLGQLCSQHVARGYTDGSVCNQLLGLRGGVDGDCPNSKRSRGSRFPSGLYDRLRRDKQLSESVSLVSSIEDLRVRSAVKAQIALHMSGLQPTPIDLSHFLSAPGKDDPLRDLTAASTETPASGRP
jgi:hypothetical protein